MFTLKAEYEMNSFEIFTSKDTKLAFLFKHGMIPFMKHITNRLQLTGFTINNKELQKLFQISSHLTELSLNK